jgi:hypothetical protein
MNPPRTSPEHPDYDGADPGVLRCVIAYNGHGGYCVPRNSIHRPCAQTILGGGVFGMAAGVLGAVLATAAAGFVFTWLRRRSGSLLAPIALHWSLNGMGALAAALVWQLA